MWHNVDPWAKPRAVAKSANRRVLRGDQPLSGGLGVSPNLISPRRRRRQDDFATALGLSQKELVQIARSVIQ